MTSWRNKNELDPPNHNSYRSKGSRPTSEQIRRRRLGALGLAAIVGFSAFTYIEANGRQHKADQPKSDSALLKPDYQHGGLYGGGTESFDPNQLPPEFRKALENIQSSINK